MRRPRAVPPVAVVNRLALDWRTVAVHEAGHVVTGLAAGLPVHEVWIGYQEHTRWFGPSDWTILGRTEVAAGSGTVPGTADQEALLVMGGLVAEALWVARRDGRSWRAGWRAAIDKQANRGDLAALRGALRGREATFIHDTAQRHARELLRDRWRTVLKVADALADDQHLSARQVRRLAGTPTPSRGGAR